MLKDADLKKREDKRWLCANTDRSIYQYLHTHYGVLFLLELTCCSLFDQIPSSQITV